MLGAEQIKQFSNWKTQSLLSGCLHPCAQLHLAPTVTPNGPTRNSNSISCRCSACSLLIFLSWTPAGWNVSGVAGSLLTKGLDDCFGNPSLYWNLIKTTHQTQGGSIGSLNDEFLYQGKKICLWPVKERKESSFWRTEKKNVFNL